MTSSTPLGQKCPFSNKWLRICDNVIKIRHLDLGERRMFDDENDVVMLSSCLEEWVPCLWDQDEPLINIDTGKKG